MHESTFCLIAVSQNYTDFAPQVTHSGQSIPALVDMLCHSDFAGACTCHLPASLDYQDLALPKTQLHRMAMAIAMSCNFTIYFESRYATF